MLALLALIGEFLAGDNARLVYWVFALAGTVLFGISGVLLMFGIGHDSLPADVDVDMDGTFEMHPDSGFPDLQFFSFRTVLAFFTMFGWGGLVFGRHGWSGLLGAFLCGFAMMLVTAFLIALMMKLQQSGNVSPSDIVGKTGSVYINIPGGEATAGKVKVNLGDATEEIKAYAHEAIPTGTPVKVVKHIGNQGYYVEKIS